MELGLSPLCFDLLPISALASLPSSAGYSSSALLHRNELPALGYIPALLSGLLLVLFLYRRLGTKKTFVLLLLLYALGAIESYHAYLAPSLLTDWYDAYAKIFFTSRNGLFSTPGFIYLGYFLADYG